MYQKKRECEVEVENRGEKKKSLDQSGRSNILIIRHPEREKRNKCRRGKDRELIQGNSLELKAVSL